MIETTQSALVAAPIGDVWSYVRDIARWAEIMPGYQTCDLIDDDHSRWTLKVGVGGMVRTVTVKVHVEQWDGPERVRFAYALEGDPVQGGGTYTARAVSPRETEITLFIQVVGSGPLAPMWEAMGRPLLPQFAKAFAGQLRDRIEGSHEEVHVATAPEKSGGIWAALVRIWRRLLG